MRIGHVLSHVECAGTGSLVSDRFGTESVGRYQWEWQDQGSRPMLIARKVSHSRHPKERVLELFPSLLQIVVVWSPNAKQVVDESSAQHCRFWPKLAKRHALSWTP